MGEVERMWESYLEPMDRRRLNEVASVVARFIDIACERMDPIACEYIMFVMSEGTLVPPMPKVVAR